ncbi:MAG: helix-turn-helix transcriptional regulator [Acidobacteria bacterium]|nr:helix-turn-helix transcriptional regulator [Acidobacteriota bacterium]
MATIEIRQPNTALLRARRRRGFERKQVSRLLGHKGPQTLAQYERGQRLPSLQNAIGLSLIYGCHLEDLFPEKYRFARANLTERTSRIKPMLLNQIPALLRSINRCSYEDVLDDPHRAETNRAEIRDHVTRLAKALAQL